MSFLVILFDVDALREYLGMMDLIIEVSSIINSFGEGSFGGLLISFGFANRVIIFCMSVALPLWASGLKQPVFTGNHLCLLLIPAVVSCAASDTTVSVGAGRVVWKHWKLLLKENSAVSV